MRNEMKIGLVVGLVILASVVGYSIINQVKEAPSADSGATLSDAGSTGNEPGTSDVEPEASTISESSVPRADFTGTPRADRDRSIADRGSPTDAADAPATGSEGMGSPSPSDVPMGLRGADRPGLSDSTTAGAPGREETSTTDVRPDAGTLSDATEEETGADADTASTDAATDSEETDTGFRSSGTSEDSGRVAPSTEDTIATTSDPSTSGTESSSVVTTHTIESGDTYSGLAVRYFGHAKYAGLISDANPDVDPRRLQVGKSIKIPDTPQRKERTPQAADATGVTGTTRSGVGAHSSSVATSSGTTASRVESSLPPIPEDRKYVVKATDKGWFDLAERLLGDSGEWTMLYEVNKERLPNPDRRDIIPVGLVIEIPGLPEAK